MPIRFYFLLRPQGPPQDAGYQHCAVALAEGLRALGIPFHANRNYWRTDEDWLFGHDNGIRPEDCDVLVTGSENEGFETVADASFRGGRRTVYVDSSDGWRTRTEAQYFRRFDLVLRTHLNGHYRYPANVHPWAFGLTERMMAACADPLPFAQREPRALFNFRVGHPVRRAALRVVAPVIASRFAIDQGVDAEPPEGHGEDRAFWEATGRRHYPSFFARLKGSMICAAFGGYFAPGVFARTENLAERAMYLLGWRLDRMTRTVMQFDSWRFWESLAAGCLTLHVDFDHYGCRLPVNPVSGAHYAGIAFHRRDCAQWVRLAGISEHSAVAEAGRAWALEHYSPRAVAARLLGLLGERVEERASARLV